MVVGSKFSTCKWISAVPSRSKSYLGVIQDIECDITIDPAEDSLAGYVFSGQGSENKSRIMVPDQMKIRKGKRKEKSGQIPHRGQSCYLLFFP
ncbi:hypothetical protein CDAR_388601 [Caerostris darwini]|uniref:Uncharacterized protein n=1 Tax=Caerostris darwini TaxID=1538125 RepID=A0AAV4S616_9ARAC|nr:hypothetical protein CDAR_388601 [Caerostris darwini]